mmetsp:Transcript_63372/g.100803  ORF Transcript_63372/g.100803 Transcript_63372/m.100803 type:complete len:277 (+) Transcript_63372:1132-1962(+)
MEAQTRFLYDIVAILIDAHYLVVDRDIMTQVKRLYRCDEPLEFAVNLLSRCPTTAKRFRLQRSLKLVLDVPLLESDSNLSRQRPTAVQNTQLLIHHEFATNAMHPNTAKAADRAIFIKPERSSVVFRTTYIHHGFLALISNAFVGLVGDIAVLLIGVFREQIRLISRGREQQSGQRVAARQQDGVYHDDVCDVLWEPDIERSRRFLDGDDIFMFLCREPCIEVAAVIIDVVEGIDVYSRRHRGRDERYVAALCRLQKQLGALLDGGQFVVGLELRL